MPTISSAVLADAVPILALQRRAYESEARLYNDWTIPPLTQTLASLLEEIRVITVLKATEGGAIVGSVRAVLNGKTCQVGRLVVDPDVQGRGIGSALLGAIERAFPAATLFELFTGSRSERNIRFYRRHGYEITSTKHLSQQVSLVIMGKLAVPLI